MISVTRWKWKPSWLWFWKFYGLQSGRGTILSGSRFLFLLFYNSDHNNLNFSYSYRLGSKLKRWKLFEARTSICITLRKGSGRIWRNHPYLVLLRYFPHTPLLAKEYTLLRLTVRVLQDITLLFSWLLGNVYKFQDSYGNEVGHKGFTKVAAGRGLIRD